MTSVTKDSSGKTTSDSMIVLGYKFAGQSSSQKSGSITNQKDYGGRTDYVLTAIPINSADVYEEADNTIKAVVTPADKIDAVTSADNKATWNWSVPTFKEPGGHFDAYKKADGAYRNGSYIPENPDLDFKAGQYSRYDLEEFDGYNNTAITKTTYPGFDYLSFMVGSPYPWTKDTTASGYDADKPWTAYGKKPVRYELADEGVYLLNDESALLSSNGSQARTIENGSIDSSKAVKLTSSDFYINKLQYSWAMRDASYDSEETGEWQSESPTYTDYDIIQFYGKFGTSSSWTKFAAYNIKTGETTPVSTYVSSMTYREIDLKDGADLTAYKVICANAHYYTEINTVPFITLKNSDTVLNLLKNSSTKGRNLAIVNNNIGRMYETKPSGYSYTSDVMASVMANDNAWTQIAEVYHSDTDYAEASERDSYLTKSVVSASNNTRRRYYTITWNLAQAETVVSGEDGKTGYIAQSGGIFYDLLPSGSQFVKDSVKAMASGKDVDDSDISVKAISNYKDSGRTLAVIQVNTEGDYYSVTFDTRHAWNSIKDYGTSVYNPAAYETMNASITNGVADDPSFYKKSSIQDASTMKGLSKGAGITDADETGNKFIYAYNTWDINALTAASSGLTKKVKSADDTSYSYDAMGTVGGDYSYEIRFMNSDTSSAKNMIFFDSLENYGVSSKKDDGSDSDWHGTLQSVDVSQLEKKEIAPVVYISTKENLDPETDHDLTDSTVWTKVTDSTDLSTAKAVVIDVRKKSDGTDFSLGKGESIAAYIYMKAPSSAPDAKSGASYPYAYNNIYMSDTVFSDSDTKGSDFLIHQDYTKISLIVTGDLYINKTDSETGKNINGIIFRLKGTSDYGTVVDNTYKTNRSGMISVSGLEKGSYILQETNATDDYLLDSTERKVQVTSAGKVLVDGTEVTKDSPVKITNKPRIHGDVKFLKVDKANNSTRIPDVTFQLSGTSDYHNDVLMTAVSSPKTAYDAGGSVEFDNVEKGTYTLQEISTPDGYIPDKTKYIVRIDESGNASISYPEEREVSSPSGYTNVRTADGGGYTQLSDVKYSYTENISEDGTRTGDVGSYWYGNKVYGSDRTDSDRSGYRDHEITISGAAKLHVVITYGIASGSGMVYVIPSSGSEQDLSGRKTTKEFDFDGNSVTFSFYAANMSSVTDSDSKYGYYAVVTGYAKKTLYYTSDVKKNSSGVYLIENEPYHYITFTKKSSYNKAAVSDAEFSLSGLSGSRTAVSDDTTGTVKFDHLESGTYVLLETKAPDGYELNSNKYVVTIKSDGTYAISGLNKEDNVYVMYDTKTRDKKITITKVWDDGENSTSSTADRSHTDSKGNQDPSKLAITINTTVPTESQRTYTINFDSNGGSFGLSQ